MVRDAVCGQQQHHIHVGWMYQRYKEGHHKGTAGYKRSNIRPNGDEKNHSTDESDHRIHHTD